MKNSIPTDDSDGNSYGPWHAANGSWHKEHSKFRKICLKVIFKDAESKPANCPIISEAHAPPSMWCWACAETQLCCLGPFHPGTSRALFLTAPCSTSSCNTNMFNSFFMLGAWLENPRSKGELMAPVNPYRTGKCSTELTINSSQERGASTAEDLICVVQRGIVCQTKIRISSLLECWPSHCTEER